MQLCAEHFLLHALACEAVFMFLLSCVHFSDPIHCSVILPCATPIVKLLGQQQLKVEREALNSEKQVLRAAAKPEIVRAALYRLITRRNLPNDCLEWPELHTLVQSISYMATDVLPTSHSTVAAAVAEDSHVK